MGIQQVSLTSLVIMGLLYGASPSKAQQPVFHEDFESGFGAWTATGLWHSESVTDPCGSLAAPFPTGDTAAYWGDNTLNGCNFNSFTLAGNLTLNAPVHIPAGTASATLRFWSYEATECDSCGWDWRFVYVSTDGGTTFDFIGEGNQGFQWYQRFLSLDDYIGEDILLRFNFDAVDFHINHDLGWLIDDISIEVDCTSPTNYCSTSPNSVGPGAVMGMLGSNSYADNDFHITVTGAPAGVHGTFFYGSLPDAFSFGDGVRCISGAGGFFRLAPSMQTDSSGTLTRQVDFSDPPASTGLGMIQPGDAWHFQFFYRDQVFGGTGFNLSDGIRVGFCP